MRRSAGAADPAFLIVGTPRSGTTLVQRLACELPGIWVPPETHFFDSFAFDLLRRRRLPLDESILREELVLFFGRQRTWGLEPDVDAVLKRLNGRCDSLTTMFGAVVRELSGEARRCGEKTPSHLLWWRPLSEAMPWLRVVAVVRDPRAVVSSWLTVFRDPRYRGKRWRQPAALVAHRWSRDQRSVAEAFAALGPSRCLVLRYEDVVSDPGCARDALAGFLGAEDEAESHRDRRLTEESQIVLPREWWKRGVLGPIRPERAHGWRKRLSEREMALVGTICGAQMRAFGYGATPESHGGRTSMRGMPLRATAAASCVRPALGGLFTRLRIRVASGSCTPGGRRPRSAGFLLRLVFFRMPFWMGTADRLVRRLARGGRRRVHRLVPSGRPTE